MILRGMPIVLCLAGLAGCSSMISHNPGAIGPLGKEISTVVPNQTVQITPRVALTAENLLIGAAIYWAVDPLAPNWELAQLPVSENQVRLSLRRKRFASGGDGEAVQVFRRHAAELAREGGYSGYAVLEYSEGVESTLPIAQRIAQGVVRLER